MIQKKITLTISYLFTVLLWGIGTNLWAQTKAPNILTQTIRGKIVDQANGTPLVGATVTLLPSEPLKGTTSNLKGEFELKEVAVGRYRLKISFLGYEDYLIPELLVTRGKEVIQNIALTANPYDLETITIAANLVSSIPTIDPIITTEKTRRFPATFFDPARLMIAYPGVVNTNDQANNMAVRGNSPNGILWRLEGVDIVNPNHLSNAGTVDDRATQNGGGVNILSTQMLGDSRFLMGVIPADYGNVQSGVFDMQLRDGNSRQNEFTSQIGLIGVDFAAEGPIGKDKNSSSFLANYRYSTLGLLAALGVQLGDEEITFQDLSFKLSFPTKESGKISVFGFGGLSSNVFNAVRDSSVWEFEKDRQDIGFDSKVGAIGASYEKTMSDQLQWKLSSVYSVSDNERNATILKGSDYTESELSKDQQYLALWSSKLKLNYTPNSKHRLEAAFLTNRYAYDYSSKQGTFSVDVPRERINGEGQLQTVQASLQWEADIAPSLGFNVGVNSHLFLQGNSSTSIEPRIELKWQASPKNKFALAYGQRSQMQLLGTYFSSIEGETGNFIQPNQDLDFTKSRNYSAAYRQQLPKNRLLRVDAYYQDLYDVPVSQISNSFSVLNLVDGFVEEALVNEGSGENYGIEVSLEKYFSNNMYYLVGGTWYESKYTGSDGIKRNTRFNGNYNFNLTTGKEFPWHRKGKNRVLSVNAAFTYAGGFRDTPIDVSASKAAERTIYQENEAFSLKMENYYKFDLRLAVRRNKAKSSRVLALDIQNVSSRQNIAFQYFDVQKGEIVTKRQLGIIPILSWRVEF